MRGVILRVDLSWLRREVRLGGAKKRMVNTQIVDPGVGQHGVLGIRGLALERQKVRVRGALH